LRHAIRVLHAQLVVFEILWTKAFHSPRRRAKIINLIDQRIENLERALCIILPKRTRNLNQRKHLVLILRLHRRTQQALRLF